MAGAPKKKRLTRAMADLRISCTAFESWIRHLARGSKKNGSTRDVVADLPDDILVDILSRLPIKSLCRCKLVSTRWRNLISHPEHSKKLAQTLAGFFYESYSKNRFPKLARHFTNVSRAIDPFIDPSLSFLPEYKSIDIKDSCNGLLLCHCWKHTDPATMDSVVCNPATEKWVVVPDSGWSSMVRITRLGFDPAVSSHFHVFEFVSNDIWYMDDGHNFDGAIVAVAVYSSKSGVWSLNINNHLPIPLGEFAMPQDSKGVFFNGILHLTTFYGMVLAIDVEGKVLRGIPFPISTHYEYDDSRPVHVYLSQGHLYLTTISDGYQPSIWVLEDYNGENWTLKHNVNLLHLFGAANCSKVADNFSIISIHPEHDMIFLVCQTNSILLSYEMDHMRLRFISHLGRHYTSDHIPYVPLFSESLADEQ
ncbi:hypothetical protein BDA96_03G070300 [Sorghum bicolor]|uniref:F-box domain-containing protein n=2 Tax=Sorghum bicolor TaxID=4558 RepID=A0A921UM09_SORBI|nr:F-box protein At5g07610 isoform X1 [Sorghum bicolor]KAG0536514.1 hypothetical protein BDA96_03G070300 [Sorghum bicolor]KXG31844.1 hypothetical protein SORBI_3003G066700 [Sorghum bicolor]|eukprot:XP_002457327.2 F-box protein At5g07610 isoform X1 [Sorghum bicolor]